MARRRRLRKELRYAGYTMMSLLPVVFLFLTMGGARLADARSSELASAMSAAWVQWPAAPAITLSIEATTPTAKIPVAFPGYLLPVDGPEDSDHARR